MEAGTFVGQFGDQEHVLGSAEGSVARAIRRMSELRRENPGGNTLSFQFLGLDPAAPTPQTSHHAYSGGRDQEDPRVPSLRYHCSELTAISLDSVRGTATAFSFLIDSTFIL